MVDPKMNQCADPIDTQHNVLFDVWRRNVPQWLDETTCGREGCICKEQGFRDMKSQDDLFTFLFCGECAAVADPTRKLPRDDSDPMQLRYDCVAGECEKDGCLQDKCTRLANCPVLTKATPRLPPPRLPLRAASRQSPWSSRRRRTCRPSREARARWRRRGLVTPRRRS